MNHFFRIKTCGLLWRIVKVDLLKTFFKHTNNMDEIWMRKPYKEFYIVLFRAHFSYILSE